MSNVISNEKKLIICPYCNGHGKKKSLEQWGPIKQVHEFTCQDCKGHGRMWQIQRISLEAIPAEQENPNN